jgi:hypothetical protein
MMMLRPEIKHDGKSVILQISDSKVNEYVPFSLAEVVL